MEKVYISGMMSGLEREDYIARFAEAERLLIEQGYKTVNPTRFLVCRWPWLYRLMGYQLTLLYDLWRLSHCDKIYKMPGWRQSKGANVESCWAYHFNVWPVGERTKTPIDKALEKLIIRQEKARERNGTK